MLVKNIISWFKNLFDVLVGHSIVPDLVKAIIAWFGKLPSKLKELVDKAVKAVINSFKSLGSIAKSAYTWGKDLIDEMVKGLSDNILPLIIHASFSGIIPVYFALLCT